MCKKCITCESTRIVNIGGKCSDLCSAPIITDEDIEGRDYIEFNVCLDCGHIQETAGVDFGIWTFLMTLICAVYKPSISNGIKPKHSYRKC